jgi:hypothetical protein
MVNFIRQFSRLWVTFNLSDNFSVVKIGHACRYGGAMADFGGPPPRNFTFRSNISVLVKIGKNLSKIGQNGAWRSKSAKNQPWRRSVNDGQRQSTPKNFRYGFFFSKYRTSPSIFN